MKARQADERDVPDIIRLTEKFNADYYDVPLDISKAVHWLVEMLEHGVVFKTPSGFILGFVVHDPVRSWSALVEHAWYTQSVGEGVRLLEAFIQAGRDLGVDEVRMTTLKTSPEQASRLLQKYRFEEVETSHRLLL